MLRARTPLGWLEGAREVKEAIRDGKGLSRLSLLALGDSGAAPLGIERLELVLSGLHLPSRQVGLWPSVRELDAVEHLLRRFPEALVRASWRDELSYASECRSQWLDFKSGEPRVRSIPGRATPTAAPATPSRSLST